MKILRREGPLTVDNLCQLLTICVNISHVCQGKDRDLPNEYMQHLVSTCRTGIARMHTLTHTHTHMQNWYRSPHLPARTICPYRDMSL